MLHFLSLVVDYVVFILDDFLLCAFVASGCVFVYANIWMFFAVFTIRPGFYEALVTRRVFFYLNGDL